MASKPPLPSQASEMGLETKYPGTQFEDQTKRLVQWGIGAGRDRLPARAEMSGKKMFQLDFNSFVEI